MRLISTMAQQASKHKTALVKLTCVAIASPWLLGCQSNPWSTSLPLSTMLNPNMQRESSAREQRMASADRTSKPATVETASFAPAVPQDRSQVVQASYQGKSTGPIYEAGQSAPYPAVPMLMVPGHQPVAMNTSIAHGCGCQQSDTYKPVYANGDFSASICSAELPCSPVGPKGGVDPQEYIYDGGDQSPVVRIRDDYSIVGLGPEDTVVQFTTEDGREFAETGCRAAIYSPRFASLRRITRYQQNDGVLAARAALKDQPLVHMHAPVPPTQVKDRLTPVRESNVNVVEAFRERNRGVPVLQNQTPQGWSNAFRPYEDLQVIRTGIIERDDKIALIKYTANAIAWSTADELLVIVDNQQASIVESEDHPQELLTYELGGARIRVCKVASQQTADVGDTVDFTIRFDNIAEQVLTDLVIHDSLPPRLEYVEDSEQCSIPATFSTEPNEVGSSVVKWKLQQPLKPGQGGIVRFQCKVR